MKDNKNTASKAEEVKAEQAAQNAQPEEPAVETEQQKAAEITITREKLLSARTHGVTRLCINPQTMNGATLATITRSH